MNANLQRLKALVEEEIKAGDTVELLSTIAGHVKGSKGVVKKMLKGLGGYDIAIEMVGQKPGTLLSTQLQFVKKFVKEQDPIETIQSWWKAVGEEAKKKKVSLLVDTGKGVKEGAQVSVEGIEGIELDPDEVQYTGRAHFLVTYADGSLGDWYVPVQGRIVWKNGKIEGIWGRPDRDLGIVMTDLVIQMTDDMGLPTELAV